VRVGPTSCALRLSKLDILTHKALQEAEASRFEGELELDLPASRLVEAAQEFVRKLELAPSAKQLAAAARL
jgi:hypothetical protein